MKKGLIFAALLSLSSVAVVAQTNTFPAQQTGGYAGPSVALSSVAQAKQMNDDSYVVLQGSIVQHLGAKKYLFKDKTGEITVKISPKRWGGLTATPKDLLEIQGEVDKDWNSLEIDVDSIRKLN